MFYSKISVVFLSVLFLVLICTQVIVPQNETHQPKELSENTIKSLIQGLSADNNGLQSKCAYFLGEYRIIDAVIPLLKLLHNDDSESVRISSALALFKIGTPIAIFAVKQAIRFDESERVKRTTQIFYSAHLKELEKNKIDSEEKGWLAERK